MPRLLAPKCDKCGKSLKVSGLGGWPDIHFECRNKSCLVDGCMPRRFTAPWVDRLIERRGKFLARRAASHVLAQIAEEVIRDA